MMEQYMFKYTIDFWEDNEKKNDEGIVVAENLKNAIERLEGYYGDGISYVSLADAPLEFTEWNGIMSKNEINEIAKRMEKR